MTIGLLAGRMVVVCWTRRGNTRHVISMRRPMSESKPVARPDSADRYGETDFAKVDACVLTPEDCEEIPELTDEWFEKADFSIGGALVRRGRPKAASPKKQVTIRLDADVLDGLRSTGTGWQTRVNAALREWLEKR